MEHLIRAAGCTDSQSEQSSTYATEAQPTFYPRYTTLSSPNLLQLAMRS